MINFLLKVTFTVLMLTCTVFALDNAGTVEKFDGKVLIYKDNSPKGKELKSDKTSLQDKNTLRTRKNSNAYVKFVDSSKVVLTEDSTLIVQDSKNLKLNNGKVIFSIQKQGEKEGIKITTKTAIIGVKGTSFIVDAEGQDINIILKEGELSIKSIKGEFKRHINKEMDEFADFAKEQSKDYEDFKKKTQEEYVQFVKEFTLKGPNSLSINGNNVKNNDMPVNMEDEFKLLDNF